MPMISLDRIVEGPNARTIAATPEADEGLRRSIAASGVLQALLLRPRSEADVEEAAGPLEIVLGSRRYGVAKALGLSQVPAEIRWMTDAEVEAAQMAENLQRAEMHPVDQWRGVRALIQDHGLTLEQAGGALGLDERAIRRMEMLGRLNATFLKLAEIEMPQMRQMRAISGASAKLQAKVAGQKGLIAEVNGRQSVNWHDIVNRCAVERIPRAVAIFDTAKKGIVWDEDLFAEPGADDQFTTADVDTFLKRQTEALRERVAALVKTKKRHQVATMDGRYRVALPSGFHEAWTGKPDRLKPHETAFHAVAPDGKIIVAVGLDTKAAKEAEAKKPAKSAPAADGEAAADADDDDEPDDAPIAEQKPKPPFTQKGQAILALAKNDATRAALETPTSTQKLLGLLVLALSCDNVVIYAGGRRARFNDLAARMLEPGGNFLDMSVADTALIASSAIGRIVNMPGPAHTSSNPDSGAAAEWIGAAISAECCLPRFDTEAFLATASLSELKRAAKGAGLMDGGTAAALRERLKGRAPSYRPEAAVFGAPAPKVRDDA